MNTNESKLPMHTSKTKNLEVFQLAALEDNYIYILRDKSTDTTAVVDPSIAEPVQQFLHKKNWNLDFILNTHHHWDHTGGNKALKKEWKCKVVGFSQDAHRIPGIDIHLNQGDTFPFGSTSYKVLFLPGHTIGHIAFWFSNEKKLFCGDTLFAMGCGRLFEGSYKQMFDSLSKIKKLPKDTEVYCAHEYTEKNGQFALTVDPQNQSVKQRMKQVIAQRKLKKSTIPFLLSEDLKTNPFLRAKELSTFKDLRIKKDSF